MNPTNPASASQSTIFPVIKDNLPALLGAILGVLVVSAIVFFALTMVPGRARKPLIVFVTFIAGLFYALEFFWPVLPEAAPGVTPAPPPALQPGENFLTQFLKPVAQLTEVLQAFAIGLGVFSILSLHFRNIVRRRESAPFSAVLLISMFLMSFIGIAQGYQTDENSWWNAAHQILYTGALSNLNAAMFSIIAFYIVSAAYRAFRIRSVEATILLVSAALVMIGQVVIGQLLTNWLPETGFLANFRTEVVADWIIKKVNSPAQLAINLGLGVGLLAASLRIWLSLERGSYFEKEL